jgi:hypothetical protein
MALTTFQLLVCEISLTIQKDSKKEVYKVSNEVVVDVQIKFNHRVCPVEIKKTRFTYENLKILGATDWKEIKPGQYTRQIKVKIEKISEAKDGQAKISAVRTCDKEGGYAVFSFNKPKYCLFIKSK